MGSVSSQRGPLLLVQSNENRDDFFAAENCKFSEKLRPVQIRFGRGGAEDYKLSVISQKYFALYFYESV